MAGKVCQCLTPRRLRATNRATTDHKGSVYTLMASASCPTHAISLMGVSLLLQSDPVSPVLHTHIPTWPSKYLIGHRDLKHGFRSIRLMCR